MNARVLFALALALALPATSASAWDPWGDITNPGRIIENVGREVGAVGEAVDQARLEAQVQTHAPALEQALIASRNSAMHGAQPIPPQIRARLQGFFDEDLLNRARFKVGDSGLVNLANLSIRYGDAAAVALIDVIVFANEYDAYNNDVLWAHELAHLRQYRDWGTRDFSIRYLRSWNGVENEASDVERAYAARAQSAPPPYAPPYQSFPPPPPPIQTTVATYCATPFGACPMGQPIPKGAPCYCPSYMGLVSGIGQ